MTPKFQHLSFCHPKMINWFICDFCYKFLNAFRVTINDRIFNLHATILEEVQLDMYDTLLITTPPYMLPPRAFQIFSYHATNSLLGNHDWPLDYDKTVTEIIDNPYIPFRKFRDCTSACLKIDYFRECYSFSYVESVYNDLASIYCAFYEYEWYLRCCLQGCNPQNNMLKYIHIVNPPSIEYLTQIRSRMGSLEGAVGYDKVNLSLLYKYIMDILSGKIDSRRSFFNPMAEYEILPPIPPPDPDLMADFEVLDSSEFATPPTTTTTTTTPDSLAISPLPAPLTPPRPMADLQELELRDPSTSFHTLPQQPNQDNNFGFRGYRFKKNPYGGSSSWSYPEHDNL